MRVGDHVRVNDKLHMGKPHPHRGKTGVLTEVLQLIRPVRCLVRVDKGIEPQGTIVVSPQYLEVIP